MSSAYKYSKKLNKQFRLQFSTIDEFLKIDFPHIADSAYSVRWDFHDRKGKLLRGYPSKFGTPISVLLARPKVVKR